MGHILILLDEMGSDKMGLDEMGLDKMGFGIRLKFNPGCKYQTQNIQILKKHDISRLMGVHE